MHSRRRFFKNAALTAAGITAAPNMLTGGSTATATGAGAGEELFFKLSLAQWSLNETLFGGKLDNLDFPAYTKRMFGIDAVEYVNQFFESSSREYAWELLKRTMDAGVVNVLIMVDGEGSLGDQVESERKQAVENHYKWVEFAEILGCHSIRVNARGDGTREAVAGSAVESLGELSMFAADHGIGVIVENHGGYSSDGGWLSSVIRQVGMVNCGTLPDFGNFKISEDEQYDRYQGTREMMPFAKGVSAKTYDFDEHGDESTLDYYRLLEIVKNAGYRGYIGIEYGGRNLTENEGILATKELLIKAGRAV